MSLQYIREPTTFNNIFSLFCITNATLGAGLLNFPQAFKYAGGPIIGIGLQLIILIPATFSLYKLGLLTFKAHFRSMQDMLLQTCGKFWMYTGSIAIALYSFSECIVFHIAIGNQFDRVMYNTNGPDFCHTWYMNRRFTIPCSAILLIFPFIFSKQIDFLKYISTAGVFAALQIGVLVIIKFFIRSDSEVKGEIMWMPNEWLKSFLFIPPVIFAYTPHVQAIPIFATMEEQTDKSVSFVTFGSVTLIFVSYSIVGTFGYLTFGSKVKSNIMLNYDADNPFVLIADVIFVIKASYVYPMILFCVRDSVNDLFLALTGMDYQYQECCRRFTIAILLFSGGTFIGTMFPGNGSVVDCLGCFVPCFTFIFPGMGIVNRKNLLAYGTIPKSDYILGYGIIAVGIIIMVLSIIAIMFRIDVDEEVDQRLCMSNISLWYLPFYEYVPQSYVFIL